MWIFSSRGPAGNQFVVCPIFSLSSFEAVVGFAPCSPKGSTVPCAGIIILHINYRKDVAELYITYIYMTYMDMLFTCIYIKLSCSVDAHTRAMSQSQAICIVGVFSKNCHTEKNTKNGNLKKKDTTQVLQDTH
jgi:hypothetical protein